MDNIRQYILSVLSAAIFVSIAVRITAKQLAIGKIIKLTCSIFLLITIVSPFINRKVQGYYGYIDSFDVDAQNIINDTQNRILQETTAIITERAQAYIEDKAAGYGAKITAVVSITDQNSQIPDAITLTGSISPYTKTILQRIISEDLGIQEERQTWN